MPRSRSRRRRRRSSRRPVLDGTSSRRPARSASRYSDPVTSTAPSGPAIARARRRALRRDLRFVSVLAKPSTPKRCKFVGGQRAVVRRRGRDQGIADRRRAPRASRRRPCPEDRRDDDVAAVGQTRQEPADAVEGVRAVVDLERRLRDAARGGRGGTVTSAAAGSTVPPRKVSAAATASARFAPAGEHGGRSEERASACHSGSQRTTAAPSATTASFSAAISSRVSPSSSVCSRPTFVSTTTGARRTFVASSRPPSPASTTATSTSAASNSASAAAVSASNWVAPQPLGRWSNARDRPLEALRVGVQALVPAGQRAGDVYAPTRSPRRAGAPRSSASSSTSRSCRRRGSTGRPAAGRRAPASSACIRSSPNSSGHGESPATQSVAGNRIELTSVARELLPLGLDDVGRRLLERSARWRASSRPGRSRRAAARARPRRCRSPFGAPASRRCRRSASRRPRAGRARRCAGRWRPRPGPPSSASASDAAACLGPGCDDQAGLASGQIGPDLLGHVRHRRMEELQQPLERGERRRGRVRVATVQPRLDRLGVPVAEVVEGQVVEHARSTCEKSNSSR